MKRSPTPAKSRFTRGHLLASVAAGVVVLAAVWWFVGRQTPEEVAKRSVTLAADAKRGANEFFACLAENEPGVDLWAKSEVFVKDSVAKHYHGIADRLRSQCGPSLKRTRSELTKHARIPQNVETALNAYQGSLDSLEQSTTRFIEKAAAHEDQGRRFHAIAQAAADWDAAPVPTTGTAFEGFFACAAPEAAKMDDADKIFRFFTTTCVHGDATTFMTRAEKECGGTLTHAGATGKSEDAIPILRRLHDHRGFVKLLWYGCAKDAYKQWIAADGGEEFVRSLWALRDAGTRLAASALQPSSS